MTTHPARMGALIAAIEGGVQDQVAAARARVDDIRERLQGAPGSRWITVDTRHRRYGHINVYADDVPEGSHIVSVLRTGAAPQETAVFLEHAQQDMLWLLGEVERLTAGQAVPYTVEQLRQRLLEIADDPDWSMVYRMCAKSAAGAHAETRDHAIRPAGLDDRAMRLALRQALLFRRHTPGIPDDPDEIRAVAAAYRAGKTDCETCGGTGFTDPPAKETPA